MTRQKYALNIPRRGTTHRYLEKSFVALNLWFEHVIDAYLRARAEGRDWREACAAAEPAPGPLRVLTQQGKRD